jgi:hypothetical protein
VLAVTTVISEFILIFSIHTNVIHVITDLTEFHFAKGFDINMREKVRTHETQFFMDLVLGIPKSIPSKTRMKRESKSFLLGFRMSFRNSFQLKRRKN